MSKFCNEVKKLEPDSEFICNLEKGHKGKHIGYGVSNNILCQWEQTDPTENECEHIYGTDLRYNVHIEQPRVVFKRVDEFDIEGMEFDNYCRKCGMRLL